MGSFFRRVWERAGHEVLISGRTTTCTSLDLARKSDVIMVSVPIRATAQVIEEIALVLTDNQVLCDLTSLKMKPVEAMLASKAEVLGLHPMFGPGVRSLQGQTILACPVRCRKETKDIFFTIFMNQGARVVSISPEEHDCLMAVIQGLTHFSTLCMAETMQRLHTDIDRALECTSPIYRIEIGLIGRLLDQDPDLYGDMLSLNPFILPMLEKFREATESLSRILQHKDAEGFHQFFIDNALTFARYRAKATLETDAVIDFLVNQ